MDFQQIRDFVNPAVAQATGLQEVDNLQMPVPVAYVPVQLVIDGALSLTSENPVQNNVIAVAIQNLDGRITAVEGQFSEGVTEAVNNWLAAHPEATTTVQDGAITYAKLDTNLRGEVDQISELQKSIPLFVQRGKIKLPSDYRLGLLYSDGSIKESNSRVTYYEYMKFPQKMFVYKEHGYRATLCTYNDSHELISRISDTTFATNLFEIPENTYFRFTVYASDDSPITDIDSVASGAYFWNPNNDLFDDSDTIALFESFAVIGDSLSCGFSGNGTNQYGSNVAREAHRNWPSYLSLKIGRPFTNLARGSSTAHDWRYGNTGLDVNIATADIDTYCYMVAVGVNDARNNNTTGTSADIKTDKSNNADSFYGNYDYVIRQLIEYKNNRFSQAKIFVFTMPPTETNAESYNTAIRYIANLYKDVFLIDLYKLFYNQFLTPPFSTVWIAGHSRPIGYMMMANMIRTAINKYITENAQLFPWTPWLPL